MGLLLDVPRPIPSRRLNRARTVAEEAEPVLVQRAEVPVLPARAGEHLDELEGRAGEERVGLAIRVAALICVLQQQSTTS